MTLLQALLTNKELIGCFMTGLLLVSLIMDVYLAINYRRVLSEKCDLEDKVDSLTDALSEITPVLDDKGVFSGPFTVNNEDVSSPLTAGAYLGLKQAISVCYQASVKGGWHHDLNTGQKLNRNRGEMLCLVHSEISEAMEGYRKNIMDDKLPHRKMAEVELADAVIRIFDLAGMEEFDLPGAIAEKLRYNAQRADHKPENRAKQGGKTF